MEMLSIDQLFEMDWQQFYKLVKAAASEEKQEWKYDTLKERLWVLEEAQSLFRQYDKYSDMDVGLHARIAGVSEDEDEDEELYGCVADDARRKEQQEKRGRPDANRNDFREFLEWHWFGVMNEAKNPDFRQRIMYDEEAIEGVSEALCCIPLERDVTEEDFHSFVYSFCHAIGYRVKTTTATGTATRLLVYRRPDYFVSFNGASKDKLRDAYKKSEVPTVPEVPERLLLRDYWSEVVEPILDAEWWRSERPDTDDELEACIWKYRAAILDVIFYRTPKKLNPCRSYR